MVLKEKEIYNELTDESREKIYKLDNKFDPYKLVFKYKGNKANADFSNFDDAYDLIEKIKNEELSLNEAINDEAGFKSELGEIKRVQKN